MKIKKRLRLNTWISLGTLALMMLPLAWSIREINRLERNVLLIDEMRKASYERIYLRDDYLLNPNEQAKIRWYAQSETLRVLLESADERLTSPEDRTLLQDTRRSFDATFSSFSEVMEKQKQKELSGGKKLVFDEGESTQISQMFQNAHALNNSIVRLHESSRRAVIAVRNREIMIILLFVMGIVIAIVINSIFISRIVSKRVAALNEGVGFIGGGNLDFRIDERGDDEFSNLARASNGMILKLKESQEFSESVINTVREPLIALDQDLRVVKVSRSFYEFFKVKPEDTVGRLIYDLGDKQWDIPKLRELLETILLQKATFENYEMEHDFVDIGKHIMLLNGRQIQQALGKERIILLAIEDITERKEIEAGLENTRKELVKAKDTAEAVNKELEAFSYSVSHDLRTPLRSIDGFGKALLEDYQDHLDQTAKSYLDRIRKATQHMGRLIDGMLKLARVTRSFMHHESVDLSAMVREISEKLRQDNPARTVDVIIREGAFVSGDPDLMRIALENLVNNAWKFSSKAERPQIEFGTTVKDGKIIHFIRDNGVGFDMAYVDKLFGAFQRLHTSLEFPGTGIGLATVQRVINRHGGRVWVEAAVGKGATFYFMIPG